MYIHMRMCIWKNGVQYQVTYRKEKKETYNFNTNILFLKNCFILKNNF